MFNEWPLLQLQKRGVEIATVRQQPIKSYAGHTLES